MSLEQLIMVCSIQTCKTSCLLVGQTKTRKKVWMIVKALRTLLYFWGWYYYLEFKEARNSGTIIMCSRGRRGRRSNKASYIVKEVTS